MPLGGGVHRRDVGLAQRAARRIARQQIAQPPPREQAVEIARVRRRRGAARARPRASLSAALAAQKATALRSRDGSSGARQARANNAAASARRPSCQAARPPANPASPTAPTAPSSTLRASTSARRGRPARNRRPRDLAPQMRGRNRIEPARAGDQPQRGIECAGRDAGGDLALDQSDGSRQRRGWRRLCRQRRVGGRHRRRRQRLRDAAGAQDRADRRSGRQVRPAAQPASQRVGLGTLRRAQDAGGDQVAAEQRGAERAGRGGRLGQPVARQQGVDAANAGGFAGPQRLRQPDRPAMRGTHARDRQRHLLRRVGPGWCGRLSRVSIPPQPATPRQQPPPVPPASARHAIPSPAWPRP